MSFANEKRPIAEGDTAILYLSAGNLHALKVAVHMKNKRGDSIENVFQTTYGALKVGSLIGVEYGSRVELSRGWAFVLRPTPELWTLTLPHRTQILYTPDISLIVFQLELRPGSVVVESGTGSGSLTHALARRVHPNGTVHSFDFHDQRAQVARDEFNEHGLTNVQVECRDVCQSGFGPGVEGKVDAIFLDLPHPWLVTSHAVAALRAEGGRFCSFSPCIEQVQRTCASLRDAGFLELATLECLQREILVNNRTMTAPSLDPDNVKDEKVNLLCSTYNSTMPGHTGYLTFATLPPIWARTTTTSSPSEPTDNSS